MIERRLTLGSTLFLVFMAFGCVPDFEELPPLATCNDGTQNGTETGTDCGGTCRACMPGDDGSSTDGAGGAVRDREDDDPEMMVMTSGGTMAQEQTPDGGGEERVSGQAGDDDGSAAVGGDASDGPDDPPLGNMDTGSGATQTIGDGPDDPSDPETDDMSGSSAGGDDNSDDGPDDVLVTPPQPQCPGTVALHLNGNSSIEVPLEDIGLSTDGILGGQDSVLIEYWVRFTNANLQSFVGLSTREGPDAEGWLFGVRPTKIFLEPSNSASVAGFSVTAVKDENVSLQAGRWHHIGLALELPIAENANGGFRVSFYLDGVRIGERTVIRDDGFERGNGLWLLNVPNSEQYRAGEVSIRHFRVSMGQNPPSRAQTPPWSLGPPVAPLPNFTKFFMPLENGEDDTVSLVTASETIELNVDGAQPAWVEAPTIVTDAQGVQWTCIKGGQFEMGRNFFEPDPEISCASNIDCSELGLKAYCDQGQCLPPLEQQPEHPRTTSDFWMSTHEITVQQYRLCNDAYQGNPDIGCSNPGSASNLASDNTAARSTRPISGVNWYQAHEFAAWLALVQGETDTIRLPTEAEWEYALHRRDAFGTSLGGREVDCSWVNYQGCGDGNNDTSVSRCTKGAWQTVDGLCDMRGNLREWVEDDYFATYDCGLVESNYDRQNGSPCFRRYGSVPSPAGEGQPPSDGSPWIGEETVGGADSRLTPRVIRGGAFNSQYYETSVYQRRGSTASTSNAQTGFRLVRDVANPPQ